MNSPCRNKIAVYIYCKSHGVRNSIRRTEYTPRDEDEQTQLLRIQLRGPFVLLNPSQVIKRASNANEIFDIFVARTSIGLVSEGPITGLNCPRHFNLSSFHMNVPSRRRIKEKTVVGSIRYGMYASSRICASSERVLVIDLEP